MIEGFLPSGNLGNILISSQNPNMRQMSPRFFAEVATMDQESATSLFLNSASADSTNDSLRNEALKIVDELCCLPLAVDQAGAAIGI
jgi:hypothetical protein